LRLECSTGYADSPQTDDAPHRTGAAPAGLVEALAESEAELDAGAPTVPAEVVHQKIRDSIARMRAKQVDAAEREAASRP
jgi:hypothetical protein